MNDTRLLSGKNILVTGTNRGMGKQMITTFVANGANIFAHARTRTDEHEQFCRELADEFGSNVVPVYFELSNADEIKRGVKEIRAAKVPINGLVNNAGITHNSLFQMTSMDNLRDQFEVNFFAPFLLTQYIVKLMLKDKNGSIVNISSSAALDGNSGKSAYGSSKAALLCLTRCLSEELASSGIRSNAICPGVTGTDMVSTMPEYATKFWVDSTHLGRLGKVEDIANVAMFLLSDASSYITGQVFRVDGGVSAYFKR